MNRTRLKQAIVQLHAQGLYPSSSAINEQAGRSCATLKGEECAWRREIFAELGIPMYHPWGRSGPRNVAGTRNLGNIAHTSRVLRQARERRQLSAHERSVRTLASQILPAGVDIRSIMATTAAGGDLVGTFPAMGLVTETAARQSDFIYRLSRTPSSVVQVLINSTVARRNSYTLSNNAIVFSDNVPHGAVVRVSYSDAPEVPKVVPPQRRVPQRLVRHPAIADGEEE